MAQMPFPSDDKSNSFDMEEHPSGCGCSGLLIPQPKMDWNLNPISVPDGPTPSKKTTEQTNSSSKESGTGIKNNSKTSGSGMKIGKQNK